MMKLPESRNCRNKKRRINYNCHWSEKVMPSNKYLKTVGWCSISVTKSQDPSVPWIWPTQILFCILFHSSMVIALGWAKNLEVRIAELKNFKKLLVLSLKPTKQEIYWPEINDKFRTRHLSTKDLGQQSK